MPFEVLVFVFVLFEFLLTLYRWEAPIAGQPPVAPPLALGNHPPLAGTIAAIRSGGKSFCQCHLPACDGTWTRELVPAPMAGKSGDRRKVPFLRMGDNAWHTDNLGCHPTGVCPCRCIAQRVAGTEGTALASSWHSPCLSGAEVTHARARVCTAGVRRRKIRPSARCCSGAGRCWVPLWRASRPA